MVYVIFLVRKEDFSASSHHNVIMLSLCPHHVFGSVGWLMFHPLTVPNKDIVVNFFFKNHGLTYFSDVCFTIQTINQSIRERNTHEIDSVHVWKY